MSATDWFAPRPDFATPVVERGGAGSASSPAGLDPWLIQQAKAEIRTLVREITELSQAALSGEEFFPAFLDRVVSALAAAGGAIWLPDAGDGQLRLRYHIHLKDLALAEYPAAAAQHGRLLERVWAEGQPVSVGPDDGTADARATGNPTPCLLLLGLLTVDGQRQGLVEIFQRPRGGPVTQRGYLRFLVQMCDVAGDYLKTRRLRELREHQAWWEGLEQFLHAIHRRLDLQATAYAIANEGRRLLGVDRVSVVVRRHERVQVLAVSGLDTIDNRAGEVARMAALVSTVLATGEPLWSPPPEAAPAVAAEGRQPLPPVAEALQPYLDASHARHVVVLPLRPPADTGEAESAADPAAPVGALVVEQFLEVRRPGDWPARVECVARHTAVALRQAREHESLFLLPLWRWLGSLRTVLATGGHRVLTLTALGALVLCGLAFLPGELEIAATGRLQPVVRQEIFASIAGTVEEVLVEHGQAVQANQVLARLRNTDLALELADLLGRKTTVQEQLLAVQRSLLKADQLPAEERNRLAGSQAELKQAVASLDRQLELCRRKEQQLLVRTPRRGLVASWHVRQELLQRPVQMGQRLMSIIDPDGAWELELEVPERDVGHVLAARPRPTGESQSRPGLPVVFQLHTHPGRSFTARVVEIERTTERAAPAGTVVYVRAAVDKRQLPDLGGQVTADARLGCGKRPLGYVWLRDVIETVQLKVLFWL